jgi:hypothetical protein
VTRTDQRSRIVSTPAVRQALRSTLGVGTEWREIGAQGRRQTLEKHRTSRQPGGSVNVGNDTDGRPITYDEATRWFSIGGIATTIDRLMAYDRGGQVNWLSDEVRGWAYDLERSRQDFTKNEDDARAAATVQEAARQQEAARRLKLKVKAYNPDAIVRLAVGMKGFAATLLVLSVVGGVIGGLIIGLLGLVLVGRWAALVLVVAPVLLGAVGYLGGYLATMFMNAAADMLLTGVQIEMNTRGAE